MSAQPTSPKPVVAAARPRSSPRWLLKLSLAVLSPLLFFGLLETGLRVFNVGWKSTFFIPDDVPGYVRTNPDFARLFFPAQFDLKPLAFRLQRRKPKDGIRVFVLGESAVFGTPEPAFGFVEQLRAQLKAHYPGRPIEVCNLGITAINSHVIYRIVQEVVDFEPDLLLVYAGNNEVIGPYGSGSQGKMPSLPAIRASLWLRTLRTGQLLTALVGRLSGASGSTEWKGMRTFSKNTVRGNDPRLEQVYANFETNLREIVDIASRAGIKTVVSTVVANLKDSAPFVSLHRETLAEADLLKWQHFFQAGDTARKLGRDEDAINLLTQARELDPEYADTSYLLGKIELQRGEVSRAQNYFFEALHWDALRFRPDPRINEVIRKVVRESAGLATLVDSARELGADPQSTAPLAGHEILFEHVHFNWEGNYRMARLLAGECAGKLFGAGNNTAVWLDEDACAMAVGYGDYGRLASLYGIRDLTKVVPFTNQIDFGDDQSRLNREIDFASKRLSLPGALATAADQVNRARLTDVANPFLPILLEQIEFQRGNHLEALELIDQVFALQPPSSELLVKKATVLRLLKRPNEAEEVLLGSLKTNPHFLPAVQALGEIWLETSQFEKGRAFLSDYLKKTSGNRYLRLSYADFLLRSGDQAGAERECLDVLQVDPGDEGALERLTQLYAKTGKADEALKLMLEGYRSQPKNYSNNLRLAQVFEAKNDASKAVEFMQALMESGPTTAAQHLRLAQRLAELERPQEMMIHLIKAKQLAGLEGKPELASVAEKMIGLAQKQNLPSISR